MVLRGRSPRPRCTPPPGAAASPRGCRVAVSPVCLRPLWGLRGGGEGGALRSPGAAPRRPRGRGLAVPAPGDQQSAGGSHSSPAPLYLVRAGHWCRPLPGSPAPPAVVARRRLLGAPLRVSGQRLVGCGAVGSPPRSLSPPSLPREVARAPPSRRIVGGVRVGGPGFAGGGVPQHCPPPTLLSPSSGPSPVPPLVGGLGLWRWRVSPMVPPVGEGVAQGPRGASCWRPHP